MAENTTQRQAIYQQDCDFYRFQDRLRWGRFQTAATIEAGLLFALFALQGIAEFYRILFLVAGLLLVLIVSLLAIKDGFDADRHLTRIREFEKRTPLPPSPWPFLLRGRNLMIAAIFILNVFNLILLVCELLALFATA